MKLPAPANFREMLDSVRLLKWNPGNAPDIFPNMNMELTDPVMWPRIKYHRAPYIMQTMMVPYVLTEIMHDVCDSYPKRSTGSVAKFHSIVKGVYRSAIPQLFNIGAVIECECTAKRLWIAMVKDLTVIHMKRQAIDVTAALALGSTDESRNDLVDENDLLSLVQLDVECDKHNSHRAAILSL